MKAIAYTIMEEAMVGEVKNLETIDKNNLFYVNFDTTLQRLNAKNRNGRSYLDATGKALFADHLEELRRNKTWFGEAGHPHTDSQSRILTIDPTMTSHVINSVQVSGDIISGNVSTLDNGRFGNMMTKMVLQGMEPAFSLRALAQIDNTPGGKVISKPPRIVTYDWVILPSHKEAYRDKNKAIQVVVDDIRSNGNVVTESVKPITESMVIDFAKENSSNFGIVQEMLEFDIISLSSDIRHLVLETHNGSTTDKTMVVLENDIVTEIRDYLTRI